MFERGGGAEAGPSGGARLQAALADWIANHPHTLVAAPYTALDTLQEAHREHRLPAWDLIVVEEAHRTALEPLTRNPYAAVHFDDLVPALGRLYLTATAQIRLSAKPPRPGTRPEPAVAMTDNPLFGQPIDTVTRNELVRRGLVSPYQLDLIPVLAPNATPYTLQRAAAYAVAHSIRRHHLRRIWSVHHTRDHAHEFALLLAAQLDNAHITAPANPPSHAAPPSPPSGADA
ncbi:hypothetical protein [Streptomyces sp. WAC00263]|uniref:hypothetical protein n=1 Tax=Streptomyces sp. WAC00263 TaxID=1917422 RepID=UPI0015EE9044|nr:hypothetical protein [Streptomyces sp. WAC00263]KAF5990241.1 hypothetical protein BOG92_054385 [Streptomyces sp. WAC00263]